MVVSHTEQIMARRQVQAMIKADPATITPRRYVRIDDGAGGWILNDEPIELPPITGTIVPAKRRLSDFTTNTELGELVHYPFIFLGPHGANLLRDDTFEYLGDTFEVKSIHIETDISTTAQIDYFGGSSNA